MKRIGRMVKIKPEYKDKYIEYHKSVWDSVLRNIKNAGIANYTIFNYGDLLFSYYEIDSDNNLDLEKFFTDDASVEWEEIMSPMQENIDGIKGVSWTEMKEIFHLN